MFIGQHKRAHRYGDTIQCADCGKPWGVDEPEPEECVKPGAYEEFCKVRQRLHQQIAEQNRTRK